MNTWWQSLIHFFQKYDTQGVTNAISQLSWHDVTTHRWVGLAGACLLVYLVWQRCFRFLVFLASLVVFAYLMANTFPGTGGTIPLNKILSFVGGSVVLVVLNLYFWMIRER